MSDFDLRELRREAAANPTDLALGRALAHALERAGERRGAFLEHCRLARLGDGAAQQRVLAWAPWSSEDGQSRARRARRAGIEGTPRVEWYVAGPDTLCLARDDDALVFRGAQGRPSVRGLDGELHWAYTGELPEPDGQLELVGDDVLWLGHEQALLFDGERGTLVADGLLPAAWKECGVRGDRLFAVTHGEPDPAIPYVVDLGRDFGRVVWEGIQPLGRGDSVVSMPGWRATRGAREYFRPCVAGAWAWLEHAPAGSQPRSARLSCIRVETGAEHAPAVSGMIRAADERALILNTPSLAEVSSIDGRCRWEWSNPRGALTMFIALGAAEVVSVGFDDDDRVSLLAIDRESGRPRWFAPHPSAGLRRRSLALAEGVVYLASIAEDLVIVSHDLTTGRERFRVDRSLALQGEPGALRVIPLERALVVEARGSSGEGIIGVMSEA